MKTASQELDGLLYLEKAHIDFRQLILHDEDEYFEELLDSLDRKNEMYEGKKILFFDSDEKEFFAKYAIVANWNYSDFSVEKCNALRERLVDEEYIDRLQYVFGWFFVARQLFDGV